MNDIKNMKDRVLEEAKEMRKLFKDCNCEELDELISRLEQPDREVIFELEHLTLACHLINAKNRRDHAKL